jgi:hypothetical protein
MSVSRVCIASIIMTERHSRQAPLASFGADYPGLARTAKNVDHEDYS